MSGIATTDEHAAALELGRQIRDQAAAYARKVMPRRDLTPRQKALQIGQTVGQCLFQSVLTDGSGGELGALVHGLGVAFGAMLHQMPPEAVAALEDALISGAEAGARACAGPHQGGLGRTGRVVHAPDRCGERRAARPPALPGAGSLRAGQSERAGAAEGGGVMPIRPENRGRYPADWKAISLEVKDAAGWVCVGSPAYPDCRAAHGEAHPVTRSKVVLTVGHLDHTPENNGAPGDRPNLRAWCQRCHNTYDAPARRAGIAERKLAGVGA